MAVKTAVIPVAGWGTRFLPASKATPKMVMPIIDRPVIQYSIDEAAAVGITDIILVTSPGNQAIEDYFRPSPDLERFLEWKGDQKRLDQIQALSRMANISSVVQEEQLGLGHAVLTARSHVGREPFAVFLPDDVIDAPTPAIKQLMDVHLHHGASVLAVKRVSDTDVSRYGIIDAEQTAERTYRVLRLIEKPPLEEAPSRLAIMGRYILTPEVFDTLEKVKPGAIGEIQLTDGINALLETQAIFAYEYEGTLHDAGTPLGLLKASVILALQRSDTEAEFRPWLKELADRELG